MESYTQGPSKRNMETLFTLRLLDKDGQLAFFVTFIGTPKANSGPIPAMAAPKAVGEWQAGKGMKIGGTLNLEAGTCDVALNGSQRIHSHARRRRNRRRPLG